VQYDHIKVILNSENAGFSRSYDQGFAESSGEYLVLLSNDTVVSPGWLSRLLRHLENPSVGMVGPVANFSGKEAKIDTPYETWSEMEKFAADYTWAHEGRVADTQVLSTFCVALQRKTYEELVSLDEQFGIGMLEDADYAQRIRAAGLRVVCAADVFVHHFGRAASESLIERARIGRAF